MKEIPLTKGKVALIDDEDFDRVSQHNWFAISPRKQNFSHTWYAATSIGDKQVTLHSFLLNPVPGYCVDHIDHDGMNNRRANLRISSVRENSWNRKKHALGTSQFKGVTWNKEKSKWQVRICINGKEKHLGWFTDEIEGANTYDFVACQVFGDFAKLNFPTQLLLIPREAA